MLKNGKKLGKIIKLRRKNDRVMKIAGIGALVAVTLFILMLTPLFNSKNLVITRKGGGAVQYISRADVEKALEYAKDKNLLFGYDLDEAKEKLEKNPYVEKAEFERDWCTTIRVTITERVPKVYVELNGREAKAYVEQGGKVMLVDGSGVLLNASKKPKNKMPVVKGISVANLKPGQAFSDAHMKKGEAFVALLDKLTEYELYEMTTEINIENPDYMKCVINGNKEVLFGDGYQLDYKMRMLRVAIEELAPSEKGTINLTVEGKAIFSQADE